MIAHFTECIKNVKSSRQEAVQMNIFTGILCGLKGLMESKGTIGQDEVRSNLTALIVNGLTLPNPILRCAAAEALGRLAQVVSETRVTVELTQESFNNLKSARDVVTRTGHSLALGCLLRYVGSMGSPQLLSTSVSILLALAQDGSSPVVQVWSLYALSLIAESGGPMFRSYVEPTLTLSTKLLLTVAHSFVDVHQCVGRLLSALMTTMGPELQETPTLCSSFLTATAILQNHPDPLVQSEAIGCMQQMHMFSAQSVNLVTLVPSLCVILSSNYLSLRKAAVSCLRQLTTREAKEVCEYAAVVTNQDESYDITELGLPAVLFQMLDKETDIEMIKNIHDTIVSMLQMLAAENLTQWLNLCKNVLTVAVEDMGGAGTIPDNNVNDDEDEDDDDNMEFHAEDNQATHPQLQPRWLTRVFAAECVRKIIASCEHSNPVHFDMLAVKELRTTRFKASDFLVLHLSDLIRMAFMAATSDSDQLRLEGMKTLQEIIIKFGHVPEPEFPGHLLLEQYQAQVGAALRPAFAPDVPSNITAAACEVCSAWIASGVARDLNDLRRVHQLLVSSLDKLNTTKSNSSKLYNESMATLEKLSILKAWAQVYIVAMISNGTAPANTILKKLSSGTNNTVGFKLAEDDDEFGDFECRGESLLSLVQPELANLSEYWLAALKDYALLSLPADFQNQLPHDGGAFYTNDTINSSRPHYMSSWPPILHAASLWLNNGGFDTSGKDVYNKEESENMTPFDIADNNGNSNKNGHGSVSADRFHMIFGICMEALCSTRSYERPESVTACLQSLHTILSSQWARKTLFVNKNLPIELCRVLHRMVLTRESLEVHLLCIEILKQVIQGANEQLETKKSEMSLTTDQDVDEANEKEEQNNDNNKKTEKKNEVKLDLDYLGEGGESGDIEAGKSLIYSVLEVELCLLVRQIPAMNPSTNTCITTEALQHQLNINGNRTKLGIDNGMLVATALHSMEPLTKICSAKGALKILPTILYLTTGVIKEMAKKSCHDSTILANSATIQAALHLLKTIVADKYASDERTSEDWRQLMQTALGTIIDLTKTGSDETKMDEVTMMMAIAVFILHSKIDVFAVPDLQYPTINHFRQCMQSENPSVRLRCIQAIKQIFTNVEIKGESGNYLLENFQVLKPLFVYSCRPVYSRIGTKIN